MYNKQRLPNIIVNKDQQCSMFSDIIINKNYYYLLLEGQFKEEQKRNL